MPAHSSGAVASMGRLAGTCRAYLRRRRRRAGMSPAAAAVACVYGCVHVTLNAPGGRGGKGKGQGRGALPACLPAFNHASLALSLAVDDDVRGVAALGDRAVGHGPVVREHAAGAVLLQVVGAVTARPAAAHHAPHAGMLAHLRCGAVRGGAGRCRARRGAAVSAGGELAAAHAAELLHRAAGGMKGGFGGGIQG